MTKLAVVEDTQTFDFADLENMKVGAKFDVMFDQAPAQLFCVERTTVPTLFLRFSVFVFGCDVAEVMAERLQNGTWIMEEL